MKKVFRKLSLRRQSGETKEQHEKRVGILNIFYKKIPLRFAAITLITMFFSMGFKLMIEQGFFARYGTYVALILAYYYVQIALLGLFFIAAVIYYGVSRRKEGKILPHLIYCTVAEGLFVALTLLLYKTTSEDFYLWTFRITENLGRLDARYEPANMTPYILIFHALTYVVMYIEIPIGLLLSFIGKKIGKKINFDRLIHRFGGDRASESGRLREFSARTMGGTTQSHGRGHQSKLLRRLIGSDGGGGGGGWLHDFGTRLISPDKRHHKRRSHRRRKSGKK